MLDPAERRKLKARAHRLEPVVIVGAKGLTDERVLYRKNDAPR